MHCRWMAKPAKDRGIIKRSRSGLCGELCERQPSVNLSHRVDVAFAVLVNVGELAVAVVRIDLRAVQAFLGGGDSQCLG